MHGDVAGFSAINRAGKLDWRSIDVVILAVWNIEIDAVCLPDEDIVESVTARCPGRVEPRPLRGGSAWTASDLDTVGFEAGETFVGEAHFWELVSINLPIDRGREFFRNKLTRVGIPYPADSNLKTPAWLLMVYSIWHVRIKVFDHGMLGRSLSIVWEITLVFYLVR